MGTWTPGERREERRGTRSGITLRDEKDGAGPEEAEQVPSWPRMRLSWAYAAGWCRYQLACEGRTPTLTVGSRTCVTKNPAPMTEQLRLLIARTLVHFRAPEPL